MTAKFRYGSVCSGIEAATVAWHPLGWEPAFFSEIEPAPRAVLAHHYPDVPLHGDFTTIGADEYGTIDLLVGGTPCQSFSVAGLRGGLDDDRGNLALEFLRLAQRKRPKWLVWENVPGVLSSNGGRDFGSILGGLVELGYGFAYRVLDAQYFGVAQRRRRVFVVGYLGDWRRAAAVLFERHSLQGHPAPSREARKDAARAIASGAEERGGCGGDGSSVDWPADVACTLDTDFASKWGQNNQHVNAGCPLFVPDVVRTLTRASSAGGTITQQDISAGHVLPVPDENLICFEANMSLQPPSVSGVHPTLTRRTHAAICFDTAQITSKTNRSKAEPDLPASTMSKNSNMHVAFPIDTQNMTEGHASGGKGFGQAGDPSFTLTKGHSHAVAFSIMPMNSGKDYKARETEIAQPLMAGGPVGGNQGGDYIVQQEVVGTLTRASSVGGTITQQDISAGHLVVEQDVKAFAQNVRDEVRYVNGDGAIAGALAADAGMKQTTYLHQASAVRRLTPVECERLQGFPDNYTLTPFRGKPMSDGPRYKALGNSMAVPVMRWIGERIAKVEENGR